MVGMGVNSGRKSPLNIPELGDNLTRITSRKQGRCGEVGLEESRRAGRQAW